MPRPAVLVGIWLAILGSGCAGTINGRRPAVAYQPDGPTEVRPAPKPTDYMLFRAGDHPGAERVVTMQTLSRREALGFAREADGTLVAVAGEYRMPLPEGHYWWGVVPTDRDRGGGVESRLAGAGQRYMAALEPVTKVVGIVVAAPIVLLCAVFGGAPGGWG